MARQADTTTTDREPTSGPGPGVDGIVSERAWRSFPELADAVTRWAELCGPDRSDLVVSAVELDMDFVSVRVTRIRRGEVDRTEDWVEWLAPTTFRDACQAAVDHFAARQLEEAVRTLRSRANGLRGVADFPPVPPGPIEIPREEPEIMAKSKATTTTTTATTKEAPKAVAAKAARPVASRAAKAKAKDPAPKPPRKLATAPRAETRSATPAPKKAAAPARRAAGPSKAAGVGKGKAR